jgi:hypothetical protein
VWANGNARVWRTVPLELGGRKGNVLPCDTVAIYGDDDDDLALVLWCVCWSNLIISHSRTAYLLEQDSPLAGIGTVSDKGFDFGCSDTNLVLSKLICSEQSDCSALEKFNIIRQETGHEEVT